MKKIFFIMIIPLLAMGMSREELRRRYKDDQHEWITQPQIQPDICPICRESNKLKSLPCDKRHMFHAECIEKWRTEHNICPICRAEIVDSVWCTCLKSFAKPPVLIALTATIASTVKSIENIDAFLALLEPQTQVQCNACTSFAISGTCALLMGVTIYQCAHPKDD